jgi:hypothetical protein
MRQWRAKQVAGDTAMLTRDGDLVGLLKKTMDHMPIVNRPKNFPLEYEFTALGTGIRQFGCFRRH